MDRKTTKGKILAAALEVFAPKGYAASTISVICEKAEVNIAAVNYHFGSKESLFQQTIRYAFEVAEDSYPLRDPQAATPEDELRCYISAIIRRSFDSGPAGRIDQILSHELVREKSPHHLIIGEVQNHQGKVLRAILGRLLRTRSENLITKALVNVVALCVFPKLALPLRKRLFPEPPNDVRLQSYIDGQIDFALAGLAALSPKLSSSL
ncbi:transcriptional regulator, TetR family protein [Verrucomicrobiia bacterium DG1235]|nr:transcriptional regulator, TetR family protein [Verrucomicrobiae bacterium DG1235]